QRTRLVHLVGHPSLQGRRDRRVEMQLDRGLTAPLTFNFTTCLGGKPNARSTPKLSLKARSTLNITHFSPAGFE
ncbi:MAG: hypothetical protein KGI52_09670, partial [Burkholderiales bacterium]|nr:hypothetical protein [Burkholderiales bacterium]